MDLPWRAHLFRREISARGDSPLLFCHPRSSNSLVDVVAVEGNERYFET
jgi:hypothetical protein